MELDRTLKQSRIVSGRHRPEQMRLLLVGVPTGQHQGAYMRKLILATVAAAIITVPIATVVKAEDTTVIKRDNDGDSSKTVIKKRDDVNMLPVPHTEEKKTIIKKENDD
jgi:hypothetical protein